MNIYENKSKFLPEFIRLNKEWISAYFEIEAVDRELAKNPTKIIENGGYIFSLVSRNKVYGVCALFNDGAGIFELARMAVSPESQGKGYSNLLMEASIEKLHELNAKKVYLVSNTKLKAAIALYKKYSFQTISEGQHPVYSRANIVMERTIP